MPEVQAAIDSLNAAIVAVGKAKPACQETQKAWRIIAVEDGLQTCKLTLQEILLITN